MKETYDIENPSVQGFRDFVGKSIFTVEFFKTDGSYRKMNAMLGVSKYVKGTDPVTTAKRNNTNTQRLQIGCYEMAGTSTEIEEKNYRTLAISPDRLISVSARGEKIRNPRLSPTPSEDNEALGFSSAFGMNEEGRPVLNVGGGEEVAKTGK